MKYQELEMILLIVVMKQEDGIFLLVDGWDEVWEDDDWQDIEVVWVFFIFFIVFVVGFNL